MIDLFPVVEVYITNVCNLTCRGCNRFNNHHFTGHQRWADYADEMEMWSKRIKTPMITIIGGEPTLNPDIHKWAENLRRLWPRSDIKLQTNGTYARPEFFDYWKKYKIGITVSLHDPKTADDIRESWKCSIQKADGQFEYNANFVEEFIFHNSAIVMVDDHYELEYNKPEKSFGACGMRHDHTLSHGKLYRCPAMSGIPEFTKQFDVHMTDEQYTLLHSYKPLSADCTEEELQKFEEGRNSPMPQCALCPSNHKWYNTYGDDESEVPLPFKEKWNLSERPELFSSKPY